MQKFIYISPDYLEEFDLAGLAQRAKTDASDLLDEMKADGRAVILGSPEKLVEALNDERVSDQGWFLLVDDHLSQRDHILGLIKDECMSAGIQIRKNDKTFFEIPLLPYKDTYEDENEAACNLHAELPVYMVTLNRNGDWFGEKVKTVRCRPDGQPEFQLEGGLWLDCTEPFIENLISVEYILQSLCKGDVEEFYEKYCKEKTSDATQEEFVDLGLPSGTLWAAENARKRRKKFFTFDEAVEAFGEDLPSKETWQELYDNCKWKWNEKRKGYNVIGKNGNSIFLPAAGYRFGSGMRSVGSYGFYWSSTPRSVGLAFSVLFYSGLVGPQYNSFRYDGFSVRLARASKQRAA